MMIYISNKDYSKCEIMRPPKKYKTIKNIYILTSIAEKEKPVDYLPHGCTGHLLQCLVLN